MSGEMDRPWSMSGRQAIMHWPSTAEQAVSATGIPIEVRRTLKTPAITSQWVIGIEGRRWGRSSPMYEFALALHKVYPALQAVSQRAVIFAVAGTGMAMLAVLRTAVVTMAVVAMYMLVMISSGFEIRGGVNGRLRLKELRV
jgi:hypothetical protein